MAKKIDPNQSEAAPPWIKRVLGRGTTEWVVRRADCPAFDAYDLVEIGHFEAAPHYQVARENWPFVVVVICVGGSGTIRSVDQTWQVGPGQALLLPPNFRQDWESEPIGWSCTILNYRPEGLVSFNMNLPRLISIHAQPLEAMITAFRCEYQSDKDPALLRQMLDIIQTKILRLFNPAQNAGRLWPLWSAVLEHPEFNWTIEALAQRAHLSGEHLRRICLNEAKRSPMAQVTWLRLKAAARRLAVGNEVIEEIAHQVGFESERAFRSAFTKNFACSPSEYRQENREAVEALNDTTKPVDPARRKAADTSALAAASDYPLASSEKSSFLPLDSVVNAYFSLGTRPWFGDLPLNLPHHGIKRIHGVPFLILNEKKGPSFLLMRSSRIDKDSKNRPLPKRVSLPIKRKVRSLYFLHACGWGGQFGPFAKYRLVYSDNSAAEQPLVVLSGTHPDEADGIRANIQDWHFSWDQLSRAHAKPYDGTPLSNEWASSQYLYTLEWVNPHPGKTVSSLEIISDPQCATTLAVLGISWFQVSRYPRSALT